MRRFLTLVCLLTLAIPAGVSISGCTRNPNEKYCNGAGYGMKITDVSAITLPPATTGISIAYGQTRRVSAPSAITCKNTSANVLTYTYGTSNTKLVDISPGGMICAGTWNRNTGGGIADYTVCSPPDPLPSTGGLPYATAFITVSAQQVTSNPVTVYVHPQVTSVSLVTSPLSGVAEQCYSQNSQATLDAQACYAGSNNQQVLLCAPSSVTSANSSCPMPAITPDIIASGTFTSVSGSIAGTAGQTCTLTSFNNGVNDATATVALTDSNAIASGTPLTITAGGTGALSAPTTARLSDGTATCSGTATISTTMTPVPNCTSSIGTLSYAVGSSSVAAILTDTTTNQVTITAEQPGTTAITASVAGSGSSAGYFSTCPPKSISLALANNETSGTISQGETQNLVTTVIDTNGNPITGLTLDYQSTDPMDISVTTTGAITTSFPGVASVYAICQPNTCNPSPINEVGLYGTGLSVSSNSVTITTPGTTSDYVWFGAPGQSQYFESIDLLTGSVGSPVRLPYVPNSMLMDRLGNNLFFGSPQELMVYSTATNALSSENTGVPGVVLAVSPNDSQMLINDQLRQLFYIYSLGGGSTSTFSGMGNAAAWSPDSKTLYITDNAALNNAAEGITGHNPTVAHTWCPSGTIEDYASMVFYPLADTVESSSSVPVQSDTEVATTDGQHILGAAVTGSGAALSDIDITIPRLNCLSLDSQGNELPMGSGDALLPLSLTHTVTEIPLSEVSPTAINQVVASPASNLAFVTYTAAETNSNATLPYYLPATSSAPYTLGYIPLTTQSGGTSPIAPLAGAFTPDDKIFFVSTAGDNMIHFISVPLVATNPAGADTKQISPNLPACSPTTDQGCTFSGSGTTVPATVIGVKARSAT